MPAPIEYVAVARAADIRPGTVHLVRAGERWYALANVAGELHALVNECPHLGGSLGKGRLVDGTELECPWHAWRWDVRSGRCAWPESAWRARRVPVRVAGPDVLLPLLKPPGVIHHVLAPNPSLMTGRGTNTYLVVGSGRHVAVVDPGPAEHPEHIDAILAAAEPRGTITHILVTHGHADHAPGAMLLGERARVRVAAHPGVPGVEIHLHEGDVVEVDEHRLEVLETPGHSDDSLSYWLPARRALFTGDVVAGSGTVIVDDRPGGLARYLASVQRLKGLGETALYPGHGPAVADGTEKLQEYLDHRAQREAQVVACLRAAGPLSVEQLVGRIYTDTPAGLLAMAARNVRAHLDKLRGEGRAENGVAGWQLT